MTNYSNPRKKAIIEDWPIGGNNRGTAIFKIESHPTRGERAIRTTEKKNGTWGKPKKATFASFAWIVDGDDGRTYIITKSEHWENLTVHKGDMKYHHESINQDDNGDRYQGLVDMLNNCVEIPHPTA